MALGATASDIGRLVLRRGLVLGVAGATLGLLGASLADRFVASLLFGVGARDPVTLGAVAATLVGIAALASLAPARASTRIDPAVTLRAE
jgi:ABC-type antimicrobial peptide transport system permease subunit